VLRLLKLNWRWRIGGKNSAWLTMRPEKISFNWPSPKNLQRPHLALLKVAVHPEEESPNPNPLDLMFRVMLLLIIEFQ
jgi:hypothetical protein